MTEPPWCDCKVAFGIEDDKRIWTAVEGGKITLPHGWELVETDASGARYVAVFRITGRLLVTDGQAVRSAIDNWEKQE